MNDVYNKFSLVDFLAYLLPGIYLLLVLVAWILVGFCDTLSLENINEKLAGLSSTFLLVLSSFTIAVAYLLGCFSSSFVLELESWLQHKVGKVKSSNQLRKREKNCAQIKEVLETYFQLKPSDIADVEYVGRSIVYEKAPACSQLLARQSSVRQLRRNCVVPTALLSLLFFVLALLYVSWKFAIIGFVLIILLRQLVVSAHSNRISEIRETRTALVGIVGIGNGVKDD